MEWDLVKVVILPVDRVVPVEVVVVVPIVLDLLVVLILAAVEAVQETLETIGDHLVVVLVDLVL